MIIKDSCEKYLIMAYRYDPDLEFLKNCENEDLRILVDYLTKDKDGESRWTESLTYSEPYKQYYPHNISAMFPSIAEELQRFGGDSIANLFRGGGVLYREILIDVAKAAKVNFNKDSSTERIEELYLQKIMEDAIEKMSPKDSKEFIEEFGGESVVGLGPASTKVAHEVLKYIIKGSGLKFYKLALIVANSVAKKLLGRGLTIATNAAITRGLHVAFAWLGPVMWAITAIWTIKDHSSSIPSYNTLCNSNHLHESKNESKNLNNKLYKS